MSEHEENRNQKVSMMISLGIHALLLIAFLFILAWREPDPPLPEYGIELNFGISDAGTGQSQPTTPPNENVSEEESAPEELPEETLEEAEEVTEEVPAPAEEVTEVVENTQDSPDVVPENESEPVEAEPDPVEEKEEEEPEEPQKVENEEPVQPEVGADGEDGESDQQQASNQGDNLDATGDEGDPQGSLDSRTLYGNPGGGGGSSLDMTGWVWDFKPNPKDDSSDTGRIVFEVKIDDQGEILSVRRLESTVSPATEKIYRQEVEKLTFSKTSDNAIPAPVSTGKITFVIRSK
ncbi:hypothetical protein FNH22_24275 [Fulvivirga sp. M361]|uniref:hypothetical protein n=1 Tax=Fulvivirga sp. M361 TaxID=2594266 RepID=UPI00117B141E|nr:hypothetical protein [Fulvivirga sp. M361]TRX51410.1 hypothetical protein FNH22_24275 [Fulvivirga sp. M361]